MTHAGPDQTDLRADVVVVGAGAAGLWAAECAARAARESGRALDVLLLEKTKRVGTKVLASGGTHCNLTTTLEPQAAAQTFGLRASRFLRTAFRVVTPDEVRWRFGDWGVPTVEAPLDKIFPESGRARDVRDALWNACERAGVRLLTEARVLEVERDREGWAVRLESGGVVRAARLLLCPGGMSYPGSGTTGDGYAWLRQLQLDVVEPVPALAPLTSGESWVHELTGIAVQEAETRLCDGNGKVLSRRTRPVLFTHVGLSGPGAMDLSGLVARELARSESGREKALDGWSVRIDLVPRLSLEQLTGRLAELASASGAPLVWRELDLGLPKRLLAAVAGSVDLPADAGLRANEMSKQARHRLAEALKGLRVPIDGTAGFDKAEVTAGGLALEALDPGTCEVRGHAGLFAFGELIDLDGPIGGLNFQAAFATGELAARAAVKS